MKQQVDITIEADAGISSTELRNRIKAAMAWAFDGADCVISVKEEGEIYSGEPPRD